MKIYISSLYAENLHTKHQDFPTGFSDKVSYVLTMKVMSFKDIDASTLKVGK